MKLLTYIIVTLVAFAFGVISDIKVKVTNNYDVRGYFEIPQEDEIEQPLPPKTTLAKHVMYSNQKKHLAKPEFNLKVEEPANPKKRPKFRTGPARQAPIVFIKNDTGRHTVFESESGRTRIPPEEVIALVVSPGAQIEISLQLLFDTMPTEPGVKKEESHLAHLTPK